MLERDKVRKCREEPSNFYTFKLKALGYFREAPAINVQT